MKIIVDMMGGDNAPLAVLEGAAQAVKEYGVQILGVGNEELVRRTAADNNIPLDGIELVNCTEVIEMCDEPARAIRQKKDSSIVVGLNLLKEGKGDAFVSAGSTGALHVGASLIVRTLRGVKRPALATMVPAKKQAYLLLDCGANVECRPEMLAAFAVMGSCYVNKVEGRQSPSVALANNGAEESKGTPVLKEAHQLLKTTPGIRFVGNIEPRDVPNGEVDVVVCDGFTGNVILKLTEGVAKMLLGMLKQMFLANFGGKIAYLLLKGGVSDLKHQMDSEEYGGAPFLGAKQPVIKAHGSSKAKGIKNAIRQAKTCVENDLCGTMQSALDEQVGVSDAGADGICRSFQCHISGVMSIGVVADFEIVHIHQRDACRADDTGCDIFIIAAVVCASQDIVVKFCTVALCCFLKLFLGFGLRLFHARALDLPWQATDQQNVRSNTKADHNELMKVQRGVKKKAVVGRKEKRGV